MLQRLVLGLSLGLLVGVGFAALAIGGLHMEAFSNQLFAYAFAAATGGLTGLVAGKPIWAKGAMIEAWLKAFFGALLAVGGMFALRKWGGDSPLDLAQLHVVKGLLLGDQPATALPVVGAGLGALFGLDNTPEAEGGTKTRVETKARVATDDATAEESGAEASPAARKRAR